MHRIEALRRKKKPACDTLRAAIPVGAIEPTQAMDEAAAFTERVHAINHGI